MNANSIPDRAPTIFVLITLVLVMFEVATAPANAPRILAASPIDAHAAVLAPEPGRMPPPDARATEGNVVDLTY